MLEDKFTHTFQDLKRNSTYSFTSNVGTYNNRFVLHFTLNPQTETAIETETVGVTETETEGETDGVSVYTTTGQQVKVWVTNTTEFQNATVKVYDAIGNMIERKNMTSNELLLDLNTATGVYLVEVVGTDKTFTKKVFITK
jgi:phage gp45-like